MLSGTRSRHEAGLKLYATSKQLLTSVAQGFSPALRGAYARRSESVNTLAAIAISSRRCAARSQQPR
jgi:hypothetical protein